MSSFSSPEYASTSFLRFSYFFARDIALYRHVRESSVLLDAALHVMDLRLKQAPMPKSLEHLLEHMRQNKGAYESKLDEYEIEFLYMLYSRLADNFNSYLKDLLVEVCRLEPRVLLTEAREVKMTDVFQCASIQELRDLVIEQKTRALSYSSFTDLVEWCEKKGITLGLDGGQLNELADMLAKRNVIVHRRGEEASLPPPSAGANIMEARVPMNRELIEAAQGTIFRSVCVIDASVLSKFRLHRTHLASGARSDA